MRADARLNRERILSAAREVIVEHGPDAPLEDIAARAGVGIATLYRRFPERSALLRAVVIDALSRVTEEAEQALAEETDGWRALVRYLHRALDLRVSAVIPALLDDVSLDDEEMLFLRKRSADLVQQMIDRAQRAEMLRPDVTFTDISLLLIRLSRPLPGPFSRVMDTELSHRHLALLLDGLRVSPERLDVPLPGPAMTLADLQALLPANDAAATTDPRFLGNSGD